MPRLLFGPCDDPTNYDRFVRAPVEDGAWVAFDGRCPSLAHATGGAAVDAVLVWPSYAPVPAWVWAAPVNPPKWM